MTMLLKRTLSYFPSKLPVGMKQFNDWAESIIELSGKYADDDSLRYALASMILHSGSDKGSKPKAYFVNCLRKSAANQVASQIFQDIKAKQLEATQAEQKNQEATALMDVASNGSEQQKI